MKYEAKRLWLVVDKVIIRFVFTGKGEADKFAMLRNRKCLSEKNIVVSLEEYIENIRLNKCKGDV